MRLMLNPVVCVPFSSLLAGCAQGVTVVECLDISAGSRARGRRSEDHGHRNRMRQCSTTSYHLPLWLRRRISNPGPRAGDTAAPRPHER